MTDMTTDRLVEALASPENLDLARHVGNVAGDSLSHFTSALLMELPTTGASICAGLALAARLRREVIEFAVKSIVEECDPAEDAELTREACRRIFDQLSAENMVDIAPDVVFVVVPL